MSTEESNEQEAPERTTGATDEDDTEGHMRAALQSADPDFGSRALGHDTAKADENDDVEGHLRN